MVFKHAQLDENSVVVGISFLSGIVDAPNMVLLDGSGEYDEEIDLRWRFIGGEWFAPEETEGNGETAAGGFTTLEELKEYTLLNMQLMLEAIEMMEGGGIDG